MEINSPTPELVPLTSPDVPVVPIEQKVPSKAKQQRLLTDRDGNSYEPSEICLAAVVLGQPLMWDLRPGEQANSDYPFPVRANDLSFFSGYDPSEIDPLLYHSSIVFVKPDLLQKYGITDIQLYDQSIAQRNHRKLPRHDHEMGGRCRSIIITGLAPWLQCHPECPWQKTQSPGALSSWRVAVDGSGVVLLDVSAPTDADGRY